MFDLQQTAKNYENWTGRRVKLREAEGLVDLGMATKSERVTKFGRITIFRRTAAPAPSRSSYAALTAQDAELLASIGSAPVKSPWLQERLARIEAFAKSSAGSQLKAA